MTTDGLHQKPSARDVEMHRLREEWNIPPAPRTVKGPPGKPDLLEGATKDEVLAAWGPPTLIKPSRPLQPTPDILHDDDGEEHLTSFRPLEEWHYETEDGIKAFAYWTEDGRLSALGIDPMDFKRLRLDTRRLMIKQLDEPQPNVAPQSPPSSPLN
ncbi:MAG: hypothetical protein KJ072_22585 [Verrucomicrobia bacterium]|nr:hypothetical protein [Verrucomicrobiota bacterium]